MSITLLPDSAPFTEEQKAWLNGFLAGMLGIEDEAGNSADSAETAIAEAEPEEEDLPWHDASLPLDDRMQMAEGRPLKHRLMAAMAQLNCGACGYVCQTYAEAIANGEESNLKLCVPGAKPTSKMLKSVLTSADDSATATPAVNGTAVNGTSVETNGAAGVKEAGYSRQNPFPAKLIRSDTLNGEGSAKDVRHVEIDLAGSDLTYNVGDSLGVYPSNCDALVDAILAEFETQAETEVVVQGRTLSVREALLSACCLKDVSDEFLELMAAFAPADQADRLRGLIDSDELDHLDLLDVLQEFPEVRPPVSEVINTLTPLAVRLYSIASSQKEVGEAVHLTVGRVTSEYRQRLRKGVASTMFSNRLESGSEVRVFVQPSHGFSVPADDSAPLIMIGPGTGIAPFRAFLQERKSRAASGKNWLFFGDQKSTCDFLYESELNQYVESGLLTRLDTAFSRDQEDKVYVQHRMLEQAEEFFAWLEQGGSVTVCGDAKRMARDVDRALHTIIETAGGRSAEQAQEYVRTLIAEGRYLKDVY